MAQKPNPETCFQRLILRLQDYWAGQSCVILQPYDMDASLSDFEFGAVNLNVVYRWEYRPGSTVYLVWTHGKQRYDERYDAADAGTWTNNFDAGYPFNTEPENTFMAKFSYWFSI